MHLLKLFSVSLVFKSHSWVFQAYMFAEDSGEISENYYFGWSSLFGLWVFLVDALEQLWTWTCPCHFQYGNESKTDREIKWKDRQTFSHSVGNFNSISYPSRFFTYLPVYLWKIVFKHWNFFSWNYIRHFGMVFKEGRVCVYIYMHICVYTYTYIHFLGISLSKR